MASRDVTTRLYASVASWQPTGRTKAWLSAVAVAVVALLASALPMVSAQPAVAAIATMTLLAMAVAWSGARAHLVPVLTTPTRAGARHRYDLTPPWRCPDAPRTPQRPRAPGLD